MRAAEAHRLDLGACQAGAGDAAERTGAAELARQRDTGSALLLRAAREQNEH
jgi:hypothetical protein